MLSYRKAVALSLRLEWCQHARPCRKALPVGNRCKPCPPSLHGTNPGDFVFPPPTGGNHAKNPDCCNCSRCAEYQHRRRGSPSEEPGNYGRALPSEHQRTKPQVTECQDPGRQLSDFLPTRAAAEAR